MVAVARSQLLAMGNDRKPHSSTGRCACRRAPTPATPTAEPIRKCFLGKLPPEQAQVAVAAAPNPDRYARAHGATTIAIVGTELAAVERDHFV